MHALHERSLPFAAEYTLVVSNSRKFYLTLQFYTVKLDHDYKNYQSSLQKK